MKSYTHPLKAFKKRGARRFQRELFYNLIRTYRSRKGYTPLSLWTDLREAETRWYNTWSTDKGRHMGDPYILMLDFRAAAMDGAVKLEDIIDLSTSEKIREYFSGHVHDWEVKQMREQGLGICWKGYRDLWRFMYVVEADGQTTKRLCDLLDLDDFGDPFWRDQHGSQPSSSTSEASSGADMPPLVFSNDDSNSQPVLEPTTALPHLGNIGSHLLPREPSQAMPKTTSTSSEQLAAPNGPTSNPEGSQPKRIAVAQASIVAAEAADIPQPCASQQCVTTAPSMVINDQETAPEDSFSILIPPDLGSGENGWQHPSDGSVISPVLQC